MDIIDILIHTQLYWSEAKGRDLTTAKKRYLALYDIVRRAYTNVAATKKKVANFINEQDAAIKASKEGTNDPGVLETPAKGDAVDEFDDEGKSNSVSKIITTVPAKITPQPSNLTKRQMELMTEAVLANLKDIVDESNRKEIEHLKSRLTAEKKARRKVAARLRYIKTEIKTAQFELEFLDDDAFSPHQKPQTPQLQANKDMSGTFEK